MSVGSKSAHAARQAAHAANPVSLPRKALLALCSLLLAVQLVPGTAWATSGKSPSSTVAAATRDAIGSANPTDAPSAEDGSDADSQAGGTGASQASSTESSAGADDEQTRSADSASPSATTPAGAKLVSDPAADAGPKADAKRAPEPTVGAEKAAEPTAKADDAQTVTVTVRVIGPDAGGGDTDWLAARSVTLPSDGSAWDASAEAFDAAGLGYDAPESEYGAYLDTITSPFDGDAYGWDASTGRFWQLFVNGEVSGTGASGVTPADGDSFVWYYSAWGASLSDDAQTVTVTVRVIGPDAGGGDTDWLAARSVTLPSDGSAWDASAEAFDAAGLGYDAPESEYGAYLDTITSPFDGDAYGWDASTGRFWQLFVNGEVSGTGASGVTPADGDSFVWYYSAWGASLSGSVTDNPAYMSGDVLFYPNTPRPDYSSEWPGFAKGAAGSGGAVVIDVPTPVNGAKLLWSVPFRAEGSWTQSDPVIVGDRIFMVADGELVVHDKKTGKKGDSVALAGSNAYFCRPVYADGLVIVPLDDGRMQAFTADSLTCVWITDKIDGLKDTQALSSILVNGGWVYTAFGVNGLPKEAGADDGSIGAIVAARLSDGKGWTRSFKDDTFYWANAAPSGGDIIIPDERGRLLLLDGKTGEQRGSCDLGHAIRAGVIAVPGKSGCFAVPTSDGVLHIVRRDADGLHAVSKVRFTASSTSTPSIYGNIAFVGGYDPQMGGTLSAIDLETGKVQTVGIDEGEVKSTPLVSVRDGRMYIYVTSNMKPGGVYKAVYANGKLRSSGMLYKPEESMQDWATASIIAGLDGVLYFTNDSRYLFALKSDVVPSPPSPQDPPASDPESTKPGSTREVDKGKDEKDEQTESSSSSGGGARPFFSLASNTNRTSRSSAQATPIPSPSPSPTQTSGTSVSRTQVEGNVTPLASGRLPIWPIVGMALGGVALLGALFWPRRGHDDGGEVQR